MPRTGHTIGSAAVIFLLLAFGVCSVGGILTPLNAWGQATGGSGGGGGGPGGGGGGTGGGGTSPSQYLSNLYLWFLGFVGIAALFALVTGGVLWMFSSTLTSTAQARKWIENALWGILLAAGSVLLLRTINPDFVKGFDLEAIIDRALTGRPGIQPERNLPNEPGGP